MKTRPKPVLSLREIYETQIDPSNPTWTLAQQQSLFNVFVALAVGLENAVNEQDYFESDLTEETERRVEDIKELRIAVNGLQIGETEIHQLRRDIDIVLKQHNLEHSDICKRLKIVEERLNNISKWPIDGHERRLAKLEAKTGLESEYEGMNRNSPVQPDRLEQIEKYPNMLKGTK